MNNILFLGEFFLVALALGVGFFSYLADTRATGSGFIRVIMGLAGGSCLGAMGIHFIEHPIFHLKTWLYLGTLVSFVLVYFNHKEEKSPFMWLLYGLHNVLLVALLYVLNQSNVMSFLFSFCSVMFLGSVTYAMVMGHWYLVTPKLSERPLKIATYYAWLFLLLNLLWTLLGHFQNEGLYQLGTSLGGGYSFNWMMLLMRIGWGYVVLGIMSYFAYRLISMRSIQSATGMLYAMTFFVFVGELISLYMFIEYGVYL